MGVNLYNRWSAQSVNMSQCIIMSALPFVEATGQGKLLYSFLHIPGYVVVTIFIWLMGRDSKYMQRYYNPSKSKEKLIKNIMDFTITRWNECTTWIHTPYLTQIRSLLNMVITHAYTNCHLTTENDTFQTIYKIEISKIIKRHWIEQIYKNSTNCTTTKHVE